MTNDVLIVGAGPTGLMMANCLEQLGLSYRIIDKKPAPSDHSKALGIQPRTLEILDKLQLVEKFLNKGNQIFGADWYQGARKIAHIDTSDIHSPFPFILILPQSDTERLLIESLQHHKVDWSHELIALEQTDQGVTSQVKKPSGESEQIQARWLLGCDGAHSTTRHLSDISFSGDAIDHLFFLADVKAKWPFSYHEISIFFHEEGILAAFPIDSDTFRIVANLFDQSINEETTPYSQQQVEKLLHIRTQCKIKIDELPWSTFFKITYHLADRIQDKNVFLLGDAFHVHSPVGGQGMNTGMQDAYNLAWKLALVKNKKASENLLKTYSHERYQNAKELLKKTQHATKVIDLKNQAMQYMRNQLFSLALSLKPLQQAVINEISQVSLAYPKSSFIIDEWKSQSWFSKVPKVGSRLPNFEIISSVNREHVTSFSLLKGWSYHLFLFTGMESSSDDAVKQVMAFLSNHLANEINVHVIESDQNSNASSTWIDENDTLHNAWNLNQPSLLLVRPDGYIAYRANPIDVVNFENYLHSFFLF